jgi:NAD(P) transhydrogenase subunit alpha
MSLGILLAFAGVWSAGNFPADLAMPVPVLLAAAPGGTERTAQPSDKSAPSAEPEEENPATIDYWSMLFVFVLSTFIGLGVIGRVSRLLHTPLMSLTNAISAIAVVGAIVVAGSNYPDGSNYPAPIRIMGAIALFASMTNIVSGFLITDRMLKMFRHVRPALAGEARGGPPPTVPPA